MTRTPLRRRIVTRGRAAQPRVLTRAQQMADDGVMKVEAPPRGRAPEAPARTSLRWPMAATVAFSIIFIVHASFTYRGTRYFTLFDDAMISMRYAHNLAHGHGLVWNIGGAHVEGYTNFGWALWMAALHLLRIPDSTVALAVSASGLALLLINLTLVRALAEVVAPGRRAVATAAVWLTATSYPLLYWSLRGMEVGLLAVVLTAMCLIAARRRAGQPASLALFGALGVVAVLTRTDAALAVATVTLFVIGSTPRPKRLRTGLGLFSVLGGTLAAHTALRWAYYGDPLPNTYYLKLSGAPLSDRLSRGLESLGALVCASLLAPLLLAAFHLYRRRGRVESEVALLLAMFAVPAAYSVYVGGDAWEWFQYANRYLAAGLPMLIVVAAIGLDDLLRSPSRVQARALAVGIGLMVVGLIGAVHDVIPTNSLQYTLQQTGDVSNRETIVAIVVLLLAVAGLRLGRSAGSGATLAMLIAAAAILSSAQAFITWRDTDGLHIDDDNAMALYGLELRQATAPDASIAVVWAGAGPYFDLPRPAIDLLGKNDAHIANEPMRKGVQFYPGHTKWDYAWSIGHLQPDLVAGLVRPTTDESLAMPGWGYDQLIPGVWVRRSSTRVDRALLEHLLRSTPEVDRLIARDL